MKMNPNKVSFITCVDNESLYEECLLYLRHLNCPEGMHLEYIAIRGAHSMSEGYNHGMRKSDAKYKVYLHQDFLAINKNIIMDIVSYFIKHPETGMLGLAGCEKLPTSFLWIEAGVRYGSIAHALEPECTTVSMYGKNADDSYAAATAVDGMFMATQYDVDWREDLFRGWHFYDISQCLEFRRSNLKIAVPNPPSPWGIHLCGIKELPRDYWHWKQVCQTEYKEFCGK